MSSILILINFLWASRTAYAQPSEGPVSVSVVVGDNAQFHCSGSGYIIAWLVDGYLATDPTIEERGITPDTTTSSGTVQSTLTVPATLVNNGTTVQCRVVSLNGATVSSNATLTILPGIGPVVNVRFTPSFSAVLWDPPATAGVLSGLSYIVIVMINNTGQVIVSANTNNTIYPLPGAPTPCQYYTANVTAFSSEYYSESVVIGQRTTGDYYNLENGSIAEVANYNTSHCAVTFTIDIQKRNTLVQTCPDQELTAVTYPKTDMTDRDLHKEVVIAETGFKEYTAYVKIGYKCLSDFMILDANEVEVGIMTIPFSSFNIQSCFVSTDNTNLLLKCTLFINSTTTGFVVVENSEETFNRSLSRLPDDSDKGSVNITGLPAGEYSVRVYDGKIDFINDMEPAYEHFETLHISSLPTAAPSHIISPSSTTLISASFSVHASTYSISTPRLTPVYKSSADVVVVAVVIPVITCGILFMTVVIIIVMMLIYNVRKGRYAVSKDCSKENGSDTRHGTKNDLEKDELMHDRQENVHITNSDSTSFPPTTESLNTTPPIVCTNGAEKHSDLSPAADEVEPVYSAPHRHVAPEPAKEKRSLHYAEVDHFFDAPVPPLPAEPEPVQYAAIEKRKN